MISWESVEDALKYNRKKVLVTGGSGFIGSYLVKELLKRGDNVTVIDNLSTGDNYIEGVEFIEDDINTFNWTQLFALNDFDEVYHLAAVVGVKKVLENPIECIETNLDATKKILDALKHSTKMPKVFISSTSEVYGKNEKRNYSETDDSVLGSSMKDRWVYASTKMLDESICNLYSKKYNIPMVIARFFSIVGMGQKSQYGMVIPNFIESALAGNDIRVYGDGTQVRSFMDVRDCVNIVLQLMNRSYVYQANDGGARIVNIGNPEPIMIKELAYRIKSLSGSQSPIVFVPYEEAYTNGFEEMYWRVPNIDKLKTMISNINLRSLDTILKDTIEYYRNKK